jgi:AraC-like DNA-binding protein
MAAETLQLVDAAGRGMVLSLCVLLAGALWREASGSLAARLGVAMLAGLVVQVIGSTPAFEANVPRHWQAPWVAVAVANAVLFWIFVRALFDDEFRLRPAHGATWAAVALLGGLNCALGGRDPGPLATIGIGLQRAVPLLFAVLAALAALAQWREDLVESRRRLRRFVVISGVLYTVGMLLARLAAPQGRLSPVTATVDVLLLMMMVGVIAWQVLRVGGSALFAAAVAPPPAATAGPRRVSRGAEPAAPPASAAAAAAATAADAAEDALAEALHRAMTQQRAYRSENLTVASLAARLDVPEYRLRRVINQRLGHRNFNAYVNGFRLDETCAALADPAKRDRPVLSIALDAGFQSIGPFNRAFKAATGLTPTEFRREKLADS